MIEGLSVPMLLDTGASRTIISESTYKQIPCESRPQIIGVKCPQLRLADGTRFGTLGCTQVWIQVDSTPVECDVIVAAVSDPGILGLDFLRQQKCQINLESNEMVMKSRNGSTSVREQSECNVALRDDCVVDARSEAIIPADVSSGLEVPHCLVSGKPEFEEKYQLKVASSLGNPCEGWVPVRILNPRAEDVHLFKGTVMGCAESVESVEPFLQHERETLLSNDASLATIEEQSPELLRPNSSEAVNRPSVIPKHLVELFERSKDNLSEDEQAQLIETLIRYQSAFAKDSMDLGKTDIIEHAIDTGDAKPIKQRSRQTPLAFREQEAAEIQKMLDKGTIVESNSPWSSPVVLVSRATVHFPRIAEVFPGVATKATSTMGGMIKKKIHQPLQHLSNLKPRASATSGMPRGETEVLPRPTPFKPAVCESSDDSSSSIVCDSSLEPARSDNEVPEYHPTPKELTTSLTRYHLDGCFP